MCAGCLPDYDDLVRDSQEDVTMEDANRILNEEDEPEVTDGNKCTGTKPSERKIEKRGETSTNRNIRPVPKRADCGEGEVKEPNLPRIHLDSAASNASSTPAKSDTLPSLYFSTAKAREAAAPPRVLGGGSTPPSTGALVRFPTIYSTINHSTGIFTKQHKTSAPLSTQRI